MLQHARLTGQRSDGRGSSEQCAPTGSEHSPSWLSKLFSDTYWNVQKRELGPYAFERRMPDRIAKLIESESSRNKSVDQITCLASLLELDVKVDVAYLCDPSVVHVSRVPREGHHFCGYRNIQMILPDPHPICSIPDLQNMIEQAWDRGFNRHGRVETGGIVGTRKHIGASEVSFPISLTLQGVPSS